jgi:hypothetical protein
VVGRLLRLDAVLGEGGDRGVQVVDDERDVPVAGAEVVRLVAALVDGQLERVAVAGQAEVDVVGALELQLAAPLEPSAS